MRYLKNFFKGLAVMVFLTGCVTTTPVKCEDPLAALKNDKGNIVWSEEYEFAPPSSEWQLIDLGEDDYSFAFQRKDEGSFPSQSIFAFTEEPYGYSRNLAKREKEFFKRFLWASRVEFKEPQKRSVTVFGEEGLEAICEGVEPVKGHKVWCKVVFGKRGERIVAFFLTQWRTAGASFDKSAEEDFDRFVQSFRFLKVSFYETL